MARRFLPWRARGEATARERERRLSLSIMTSLASKGAGFFAQVLTLPLVVAGLGQTRYAAYLALTAFIAWVSPLGFGILPALTRELAGAAATGSVTIEARLVGAAFWFTLTLAILLVCGTLTTAATADIGGLIGVRLADHRELTLGFIAAMGTVSVHFFATLSTSIRAGYQENYVSSALSLLANIVIIVGTHLIGPRQASIGLYLLAIYTPFTAVYLIDVARIFIGRPRLWPPRVPRRETIFGGDLKALYAASGATWAAQLHSMVTVFGSILLISHLFPAGVTAAAGSLMRATVLASSVVTLFIWPIVPALSDAASRGDAAWVRLSYLRLIGVSITASVLFAGALVVAGPAIFHLWLGHAVNPSRAMCIGFAAYFVVSTMNLTNFNVLLGLGAVKGIGRRYLAEAVLVAAAGAMILPLAGPDALGWLLAGAATAVNSWFLLARVRQRIGRPAPVAG